MPHAVAGLTLFLNRKSTSSLLSPLHRRGEQTDQSLFKLAVSLANRSAFRRSKFLRSAICSFSYSVSGLSDGRNKLLASFPRLLISNLSNCRESAVRSQKASQ